MTPLCAKRERRGYKPRRAQSGSLFSLGEQFAITRSIVLEKRTKIRHFLPMPGTIERSYHSLGALLPAVNSGSLPTPDRMEAEVISQAGRGILPRP